MRPDGPAAGVIADEIGVPLRDSAVVDDLIIGGFFGCVDGEPFAACCEQSIAGDEFACLGSAADSLAAVAAVAPEGMLAGGADRLAGDGKVQHAGVAREDLLDDAGFDRGVRIVFIARVDQVARLQRLDETVPGSADRLVREAGGRAGCLAERTERSKCEGRSAIHHRRRQNQTPPTLPSNSMLSVH
ncbi:unnamed protein product [Tuwongella immobilis]|uniref:Uncharacterized protein n=1 Tax=Tuwongella immobilis TaxID=692036 RepID=A0A6C2YJR5_9BACT|nr:unnamed protein product [Tuwongella immobilis]VTR99543.1 unnamed protein product [Tuwongella immobilis]